MKNQFSVSLKEVISFSREEAVRLNSDAIGTGHLMLALIKQDHNVAILLLKKADIAKPEGGKIHTDIPFGSEEYAQLAG